MHHYRFERPSTYAFEKRQAPRSSTWCTFLRSNHMVKRKPHCRLGHRPTATVLPLLLPPSALSQLFFPSTSSCTSTTSAVSSTPPFSTSACSASPEVGCKEVDSSGRGKTNLRASGMSSKGVDDSLARRRRERVRRRKRRWEVKMPASRRRLGERVLAGIGWGRGMGGETCGQRGGGG